MRIPHLRYRRLCVLAVLLGIMLMLSLSIIIHAFGLWRDNPDLTNSRYFFGMLACNITLYVFVGIRINWTQFVVKENSSTSLR